MSLSGTPMKNMNTDARAAARTGAGRPSRTRFRAGIRRGNALFCAAALCAVLTGFTGCADREEPKRTAKTAEFFIAVGHDCPQPAEEALTRMCDQTALLSRGSSRVALQYWDNPLDSDAEVVFAMSDALARTSPELTALDADFLFVSSAQADEAMNNSQKVLEPVTEAMGSQNDYVAYAGFYCGRTVLLTGDDDLAARLHSDDTQILTGAVEDLTQAVVRPLDLSAEPNPGTVCAASTDALIALNGEGLDGYSLLDLPYRCRFGMLLLKKGIRERIGARPYAALLEAIAAAKPEVGDLYMEMDQEIISSTARVITPSVKMRRLVREARGAKEPEAVKSTELYKQLDLYAD